MPETLKKLREPAALAAVVYAGVVILVGIINLLAPPGNGGSSVPFSDRAFEQSTVFFDLDIAASVAFAVYLANYVAPALEKARVITLAALVESGLAALFGVVTTLAGFGASGVDGESKLLKFLQAVGGGAVVAAAGLFVWLTWQTLAPATSRPGAGQGGAFGRGGGWQGPGSGSGGAGGANGPQYGGQPTPPPGGFGWSPQQGGVPGGQSAPTAFGQPGQGQSGGQPGQGNQGNYGQQQAGQGQPGQQGGYGQQSGQGAPGAGAGNVPGTPGGLAGGLPGAPGGLPGGAPGTPGGLAGAPGVPGGPAGGAPVPGAPQPFGADRTQLLPPIHGQQSTLPQQSGQPSFGQQQSSQPKAQQMGQQTVISASGLVGSGLSGSGSHQNQPPLPPTMQGYAAEPSPWSPGGPGAGTVAGGPQGAQQPGQQAMPGHAGQPGQPGQPGHGQPGQPGQQIPSARGEEQDQRPGPFQIGDWRSE